MIYRTLGRTGIEVGVVGMGTEYFQGVPRETVAAVVQEALDRGASYIDAVYAFPEYRDAIAAGLSGRRDKAVIAGHLGCAVSDDGQYRKTKDPLECERYFDDLLRRLDTDHTEPVALQWIDSERELKQAMRPGGVLDVAKRLEQQGKARYVGLSAHKVPVALTAVQSGEFDMLMFPVNMAWNVIPGRNELLEECERQGVAVVAMKPYAGGRLFQEKGPEPVTPTKCLSYVLDQRAVAVAVPGMKSVDELRAALAYVEATEQERDYSVIIAAYQEDLRGNCVYCNHCLPCPAGIDIGYTLRRLDASQPRFEGGKRVSRRAKAEKLDFYYGAEKPSSADFNKHGPGPEACTACGLCSHRCPFDVDVVTGMQQAATMAG